MRLGRFSVQFLFSAELLKLARLCGDQDMAAEYSDRWWKYAAIVEEILIRRKLIGRVWDVTRLSIAQCNLTETLSLLTRRWAQIKQEAGIGEINLTTIDEHPLETITIWQPFWEGHKSVYQMLFQDADELLKLSETAEVITRPVWSLDHGGIRSPFVRAAR